MVAGIFHWVLSAMDFIVPRSIFPERVLGKRLTTAASLKAATGPILPRTSCTTSLTISDSSRVTPELSTSRPRGSSPLSASATPTTAHSATSGWDASTSSMAPVDNR